MKSVFVWMAAAVAPCVLVAACGGGESPPPATPPSAPTDPVAAASAPPAPAPATPDSAPAAASATPTPPPAPADTSSHLAHAKHDPAWAACHQSVKVAASAEASVAALARSCAKATGLKPLGRPIVATQDASGGAPASYPLRAKAGKCYRVFAHADKGVKDLDIAIIDSAGGIAAEDNTDAPSAVVVDDGAVCFQVDDAAAVAVRVETGKGKYAIEIDSDE
jgi:hypothetical protein